MYRNKVILFFSVLIPPFALALGLIFFIIKFPLYIPAEYWIPEVIQIKEHYAKTIKGPKIIIISGSNSLFGICSPLLKEKTNKEIINFGTNLNLPSEIYFALAKRYAKENDIILMPLEYTPFYTHPMTLSDWHITNLTTWGTEFIKEFQTKQILELLFKAIHSIPERIKNFSFKLPIRTYQEYMENKNTSAILSKLTPDAYQSIVNCFDSINYFGDNHQDTQNILKNDFVNDYFNPTYFNDDRFQQIKKFAESMKKHKVKAILTYPVSIQNPDFDLSNKEHLTKIEALNNKIHEHGLNIIGIPELSNFELKYSLESRYHLNAEGAILRSLYFADMINCYLANKPLEIADLEKYKTEKKAEAKMYLNKYRELGYFTNQ